MEEAFWPSCVRHLEQRLPSQQFNSWIRPLRCEGRSGGLRLLAPNRFVQQWVKDRFLGQISELALAHFGRPVEIDLEVSDTLGSQPLPPAAEKPPEIRAPVGGERRATQRGTGRLNPGFTFETFVTGKANQLARAAAIQVAEFPGSAYNPLFIYGGVGLGKTHLIHAIGNHVLGQNPDAKIRYIHAEQYVSDVVRAYQHKAFEDFKQSYHSLDLLLIDDIQFFSGKNRTQEEFFYLYNALVEAHKQVVITSDNFPKELNGIEDRLISRFGWGLTVAVEPPEQEMRVAILLTKAAAESISIDEDVAFFMANLVRSNVRELEGALKRVMAFSRFTGLPITIDLAREALKDLVAVQNRQITIENIQKTAAEYYKIKVSEMYSKRRSRTVARPRQMAMALAKELTAHSLPDIGESFGGRDHTTVLHACRKIAELRRGDPEIAKDFDNLMQILRG